MKLKNLSKNELDNLLIDNLIFLGYRGSISHGMYIPNSNPDSIDDKDVIGIFISEPFHYLGLKKNKETVEKWYKEWDCVYYELKKFLILLLKSNPNVLSTLWLDEKYIIYKNNIWDLILKNRNLFISKQAYHSFYGYAKSQLHKMTHNNYNGYMGEKRKRLVDKYGWDVKNGSHLIRLLRMGIEYLVEGRLYVERTKDASELLEIKKGEWSLEKVKEEAERLFVLCDKAYVNSKLPNEPDYEKVNELCISILKEVLYNV